MPSSNAVRVSLTVDALDLAESRLKSPGACTERIKAADTDWIMVKGVFTGTFGVTPDR
jgi:hypothetical protein